MQQVSCNVANNRHVVQQVFCEEAGSDAGYFRQFVAASYGRFWARYAPRLGQRPHCYEVCTPPPPPPPPHPMLGLLGLLTHLLL